MAVLRRGGARDLPACHRIRDKVPARFLTLSGALLGAHNEEILHLVRNIERKGNAEQPLQRIMAIEQRDGDGVISFTDPHLARDSGEAIRHPYDGELAVTIRKKKTCYAWCGGADGSPPPPRRRGAEAP